MPTPSTHPHFPLWDLGYEPDELWDLFWPGGFQYVTPKVDGLGSSDICKTNPAWHTCFHIFLSLITMVDQLLQSSYDACGYGPIRPYWRKILEVRRSQESFSRDLVELRLLTEVSI
jgi:hypothetical protein